MFILGNLLYGITVISRFLIRIMIILILAKVLMSWVDPGPLPIGNGFVLIKDGLNTFTEPFLGPLRVNLPLSQKIGIDLSPAFGIILLWLMDMFILGTIEQFSVRMKAK